jgi:hypothetical protein
MFRVPDSLNMISYIFVYICEIKGVFFAMNNNSSVLLYLFRAQISSNLLGINYGKKQEPNFVLLTGCKEHKVNTPYSTSHFRD